MILTLFWVKIYFVSAWKKYLRTNKYSALYLFILCALLRIDPFITAYNAPEYGISLVRMFSYLDWIREYLGWQPTYSRIQSKCENMLTRYNPHSGVSCWVYTLDLLIRCLAFPKIKLYYFNLNHNVFCVIVPTLIGTYLF